MTPLWPHHLLSVVTQTRQQKGNILRFLFHPSALFHFTGVSEGVVFTATSSIMMFNTAQQIWQHYGEHITARLWNHMQLPLWERSRNFEGPFLLDGYYQEAFLWKYERCASHWSISRLYFCLIALILSCKKELQRGQPVWRMLRYTCTLNNEKSMFGI